MNALASREAVAAALRRPPFQQFLRIEPLEVDADGGAVLFELPYRAEYARAPDGTQIHGGVIAAFIDVTADYALSVRLGNFVPTIDLRVDYLRPAAGTLRARGRVVKAGRRVGVVDVEVTDANGRAVALGRGLFAIAAG